MKETYSFISIIPKGTSVRLFPTERFLYFVYIIFNRLIGWCALVNCMDRRFTVIR